MSLAVVCNSYSQSGKTLLRLRTILVPAFPSAASVATDNKIAVRHFQFSKLLCTSNWQFLFGFPHFSKQISKERFSPWITIILSTSMYILEFLRAASWGPNCFISVCFFPFPTVFWNTPACFIHTYIYPLIVSIHFFVFEFFYFENFIQPIIKAKHRHVYHQEK